MLSVAVGLTAIQLAVAIVLDTAALIVWNVGTRSPAKLVSDLRDAVQHKRGRGRGLLRFALGACAIIAASVTIRSAVSISLGARAADFSVVECYALVVALGLEQFVGPQLRSRRPVGVRSVTRS